MKKKLTNIGIFTVKLLLTVAVLIPSMALMLPFVFLGVLVDGLSN